jgi:hypothetical protein
VQNHFVEKGVKEKNIKMMNTVLKELAEAALIISGVAISTYVGVQLYSVYHGGVIFKKTSTKTTWKNTKDSKALPWEKEVHLLIMEKGPGREYILRDLQAIVNEDPIHGGPSAICTQCGAYQDEIVFRKQ